MKTIGLIGGTSWPSTIEYYRILNQLVNENMGGFHSAKLLLKSIDYHEIKNNYAAGWDKIPGLLKKEIQDFLICKPDCIILCNNTLHKAYDLISAELNLPMPFFHAVNLTAQYAVQNSYRNLLLLATKFTMEDGFFIRPLEQAGLNVTIPSADDRQKIQDIQTQLAQGILTSEFIEQFGDIISRYKNVDAVVLACTELPLAITKENCSLPIINPVVLQCEAAAKFALEK